MTPRDALETVEEYVGDASSFAETFEGVPDAFGDESRPVATGEGIGEALDVLDGFLRPYYVLTSDMAGHTVKPYNGSLAGAILAANASNPGYPGAAVDVLEFRNGELASSPDVGSCIECFNLFAQRPDMEEQLCPEHDYHTEGE